MQPLQTERNKIIPATVGIVVSVAYALVLSSALELGITHVRVCVAITLPMSAYAFGDFLVD